LGAASGAVVSGGERLGHLVLKFQFLLLGLSDATLQI
jgi:hypothetical protein